ncbi:MAG: glycosyltransferase family 4 protein [Planctomycetaceae bacterium]|nr:glycosyltransferase family 4 protein [Planctomycetaceae bacterium]
MSVKRVAFVLPGLGRVQRGAETAFLEIARNMAAWPDIEVELFGTGEETPEGLKTHSVGYISRERFEKWPSLPFFRNEYAYEELTFTWNLRRAGVYDASRFDATVSCTFPHVNTFLSRRKQAGNPVSIFVTQNGDWMCRARHREYRLFDCDGLVCINPEYYERNKDAYPTVLIPNGTDPDFFTPDCSESVPAEVRIEHDGPVVVMASAMIRSKRVAEAIDAVALIPNACLVVAGDGPDRAAIAARAEQKLPGRHRLLGSVKRHLMPHIFRQADAFLHMSQEEPFGIVYLEAGASGLPIVCHDSEISRWIMGDCAEFVDTSDVPCVAAALQNVIRQPRGAALASDMRERIIADWSWAAQAAKYRQFLYQLLGEPAPEQASHPQELMSV